MPVLQRPHGQEGLAAGLSARIEIDLRPPLVAGRVPSADALIRELTLADRLSAVVALDRPEGLARLKTLHIAMTLLLAASLLIGILLSLRAVRGWSRSEARPATSVARPTSASPQGSGHPPTD